MQVDIVSLILIMGAVNGLILGVILWNIRNANVLATRIFGLIVILFALLIADELVDYINLNERYPHLTSISDGFILVINPLLYWYAQLITEDKKKISLIELVHLLPFVVFILFLLPFYTLPGSEKPGSFNYDETGFIMVLKSLLTMVYITLSLVHVSKFAKGQTESDYPNNNYTNIRWFGGVLWCLAITGLIIIAHSMLNRSGVESDLDTDTISVLILSAIFYVNSFVLIKNPFILWGVSSFEPSLAKLDKLKVEKKSQYRTSPLKQEDLKENMEKLLTAMQDQRPYLQTEFGPKELEELTGIKAYYISQTLSEVLNKNFYEFVSAFRVEEAKRMLLDPSQSHKTILALGLESGFNSKSSFNRAFKKFTGKTPSEFKRQHVG